MGRMEQAQSGGLGEPKSTEPSKGLEPIERLQDDQRGEGRPQRARKTTGGQTDRQGSQERNTQEHGK